MATSRVVNIAYRLIGGRQVVTESEAVGRAVKRVGEETRHGGVEATKAGNAWQVFSGKQREARKETERHHGALKSHASALKSIAGTTLGFGGAFAVADIAKGSIDQVKELGHEMEQLKALGLRVGNPTALLLAYRTRGMGA